MGDTITKTDAAGAQAGGTPTPPSGALKAGRHTTEFWLTLALALIGGGHDILQVLIGSGYATPWGVIAAAVTGVLYNRGRQALKIFEARTGGGAMPALPDLAEVGRPTLPALPPDLNARR